MSRVVYMSFFEYYFHKVSIEHRCFFRKRKKVIDSTFQLLDKI